MYSASAWRSLYTDPLTHLVDLSKEHLTQEFQQKKDELIQQWDLITKSLEDVQQTQQLAGRKVRMKDLEITNLNS